MVTISCELLSPPPEIALSKSVPQVVDALPQTPTAHPSSSLHSTPSTTMSPGLTPFTTPTASPHSATLAAFLARASSSLHHSPQGDSPLGGAGCPAPANEMSPSSATNPLASPQGASPLIATTLGGKHVFPIAAKQLVPSPVSAAKAVLHQRCPSNQSECASPLTKYSIANAEGAVQSSVVQGSPSSLVASKSPSAAKFVTVSILQQLQQNPNISKLLSAATAHKSNGNHQSNGNGTST